MKSPNLSWLWKNSSFPSWHFLEMNMAAVLETFQRVNCVNPAKSWRDKLRILPQNMYQEFRFNLVRRGPNYDRIEICNVNNNILLFSASVLWLQGEKLTKQPLKFDRRLLVYNGDIFDVETSETRRIRGDTELFFHLFDGPNLVEKLHNLNGPFAFVHLDEEKKSLGFSRDKYGRRSLLLGKSKDGTIIILCSVAKQVENFDFIEVPSSGIFRFDFGTTGTNDLYLTPWVSDHNQNYTTKLRELELFLGHDIKILNDFLRIEGIDRFNEPSNIVDLVQIHRNLDDFLTRSSVVSDNVGTLEVLLRNSVEKRVNPPKFCKSCMRKPHENNCNHSTVGILFSGGVDCAILALLTEKFLEKSRPIELFNVAFSNCSNFETPDRLSGLQTLEELQQLCPDRSWIFTEINIDVSELDRERKNRISHLIYPLNTVLDDSLGCALWFASRGLPSSTSRVLLVGMGADELFGGYTRHRAAFKRDGWAGLNRAMLEDWENLPYRNLGRDDRVVSDHGRQLRTPYLDEDLVRFVRSLNCWEKTIPSEEISPEVGMKYLLRCLAHRLGLRKAALLRKKAMQFGSKIANPKENAHEVSPRLK